jgi:hypothetical protein
VDNFWAAFFILYLTWITSDTLSFHTWSIFLKAFPEQIDRHTAFRYSDQKSRNSTASSQLPSMIERLAKLDVSVLTFFCVQDFVLNIDHLIALTKIDSLAVLVLERPMACQLSVDSAISIKEVLNWGRSVRESGAFQKLKVLAFGNLGPASSAVLTAASNFPALTLVGVFNNSASDQLDYDNEASFGSWYPTKVGDAGLHASSIWQDRGTTKAQKIQQIYDHSHELSRKSRTELSPYQSVSMSYIRGQGLQAHNEEGKVAWYHRELEQNAICSTTQPGIEDRPKEKSNVGEGSHHKKRKVREGKGIDVGSLLSSFS